MIIESTVTAVLCSKLWTQAYLDLLMHSLGSKKKKIQLLLFLKHEFIKISGLVMCRNLANILRMSNPNATIHMYFHQF